jgi:hypothetical protein
MFRREQGNKGHKPEKENLSRVRVPVKMVSVARKHDRRTAPRTLFRREQGNKGHKPEKENPSWVRVPVKIVFVARKLGTTEQPQYQSCLFRRGDYKNKGNNPENLSWVRVLVKTVSVAR